MDSLTWKRFRNTNVMVSNNGDIYNLQSGKFVDTTTARGYKVFTYSNLKSTFQHRAVAELFIPNPLNLPEVNHKNLDKKDNRVENLEWVSREQNLSHCWDNGMKRKGSSHGMSKLTEQSVSIIKVLILHTSSRKIAHYYGVTKGTILSIKNRGAWSHVSLDESADIPSLIKNIELKYSCRLNK